MNYNNKRTAKHRNAAKNDEKMVSLAGANYTSDASLKQPRTMITVDSDEVGGVSVSRSESE